MYVKIYHTWILWDMVCLCLLTICFFPQAVVLYWRFDQTKRVFQGEIYGQNSHSQSWQKTSHAKFWDQCVKHGRTLSKGLTDGNSEISEAYSTYVYIIIHIFAYFWCQGSCHVHAAKPVLLNSTLVGTRFFFTRCSKNCFPQKAWKSCCPKTKLSF